MQFYTGTLVDTFLINYKNKITQEINSQTDNYILNINIDDYVTYLVNKFGIVFPEFHFDEVYADTTEKEIPTSKFSSYDFMFPDRKKTIKKQVIIYHIPYTGDIELLQLQPNPHVLMHFDANIDKQHNCVLIEVINFYNDPEKIKKKYEEEIKDMTCNYNNLKQNFDGFIGSIEIFIKQGINSRKQQLLQQKNILSSLGVPIKEKDDVAKTFSVPNPKLKEKIIVKPKVLDSNFVPEPSLDDENHRKILKIINDIGKNFERMPSTYKDKSEEDIRDHILFILDPNFVYGSSGGETFNKIGKTDISLRYDSSVVFIAECKYWRGEKNFLKTIDQLLGYLTWRDSKTAIINFVQNNDFTNVLEKIKCTAPQHTNYLKVLPDIDETWYNYKFHLPEDRNREIHLAVISFHLPK